MIWQQFVGEGYILVDFGQRNDAVCLHVATILINVSVC